MKSIAIVLFSLFSLIGCDFRASTTPSDEAQQVQQEKILQEATAQTGMPAIKNFRERKLVKDLFELRDQEALTTWTYLWSPFAGKFVLLGESLGYGISAATQYTNPEKIADSTVQGGYAILPQADPNGLFSPGATDGTWVLLIDPNTGKMAPAYIEERVTVLPFMLPPEMAVNHEDEKPL